MNDILNKLHAAAASPRAQMDGYLAQGKKIVLCAPVYTPEELIHAMGFVPMGAWGGDVALNRAKEYCPAFLCAIVQSLLELGINGAYEGASAIAAAITVEVGAESKVLDIVFSSGFEHLAPFDVKAEGMGEDIGFFERRHAGVDGAVRSFGPAFVQRADDLVDRCWV